MGPYSHYATGDPELEEALAKIPPYDGPITIERFRKDMSSFIDLNPVVCECARHQS